MSKKKKTKVDRRKFVKATAAVTAAAAFSSGCSTQTKKRSVAAETEPEYDFIVVGTGAGGAPLASRLALYGYSVLCIEAGLEHKEKDGSDPLKMSVPAYHGISTEVPEWSWNYFVRHNKENKNILGKSNADLWDTKYEKDKGGILYPRASTIGGCTTHNAMITMLPDNQDWHKLMVASGDRSWAPDNMRTKYFKRIERNLYKTFIGRNHGRRGWLSTRLASLGLLLKNEKGELFGEGSLLGNPFTKIALANAQAWKSVRADNAAKVDNVFFRSLKRFFDASSDYEDLLIKKDLLALDTNATFQRSKLEGMYRCTQAITEEGKRSGPRERLLDIQEKTGRIDIATGHLAAEIIFKDDNKTVDGVRCLFNKETSIYKASPNYDKHAIKEEKFYRAKREVILAGGAFNTPQLLMLSGIGNEKDLEEKGITPRINLPLVGQNLQDRYEVGVVSELNEDYKALKDCTFTPEKDPCLEDYKRDPDNALYTTNGVLIGNMVRSRNSDPSEDPDLFIFAAPGDFRGYVTGWSESAARDKNKLTWAVLKAKTSNTSGTVKLRSNDPTDTPEINFNHFTDNKEDLLSVLDGVNFARRINKQTPLAELTKEESWPGKDVKTDAQLEKFITNEAWGHHASCTCPMGRYVTDSVVDYNFKVHNTNNLRIVDASVFPKIPGHFIVLPIYMIAEKAADVIRKSNPF